MSVVFRRGLQLAVALFFVAALVLVATTTSAIAQDGKLLAVRAREILARNCFRCHGNNGIAAKNVDVLNYGGLINSRIAAPRDAGSPLLKVVTSGVMPLGGPRLGDDDLRVLQDWIMTGALSWEPVNATAGDTFISDAAILNWIRSDLLSVNARDRRYLRYLSFAHLHNAGVSEDQLETYRMGLAKLINSLSWHPDLKTPVPLDNARTIFRIDLRDYNWTSEMWDLLLSRYPYTVRRLESEAIALQSAAKQPYVRADWFAANASVPPLYHELLGLPRTLLELESLLGVDATRNLSEEKNVLRGGVRVSAVSQNNRVLERQVSTYGAYWKSFDFASNLGDQNIFRDPIRLRPAGSEAIFNLPNGLQAYFLADSDGRRIDSAPITIVTDRNNPSDPIVRNGRSCMSCHYAGIQPFKDDVRPVLESLAIQPEFELDKALALYRTQPFLDELIGKDRARFQSAMMQCGSSSVVVANSQAEPINALSQRFAADLSTELAAAEVGMKADDFRSRLGASPVLLSLGMGQLMVPGGGIKRDAWEKNFRELVRELVPEARLTFAASPGFSEISHRKREENTRIAFRPIPALGVDPTERLRSARSIFVRSMTVFLKPARLEKELLKRPDFQSLALVVVKDRKLADLEITVDRPLFTYTFTFTITDLRSSILLESGKVTAFDGNFAAPKIAKGILKRVKTARGIQIEK